MLRRTTPHHQWTQHPRSFRPVWTQLLAASTRYETRTLRRQVARYQSPEAREALSDYLDRLEKSAGAPYTLLQLMLWARELARDQSQMDWLADYVHTILQES